MPPKRPWYLSLYVILGVPLLLCCIIVQSVWFPNLFQSKPTGDKLMMHFHEKRYALEELAEMMEEDQTLNGIGLQWTRPSPRSATGLSGKRIRRYRSLMRKADVTELQRTAELGHDLPIDFRVYGKGTLGEQFGFIYTESDPIGTMVDTPQAMDMFTGVARLIFQVDENWYIYYRNGG